MGKEMQDPRYVGTNWDDVRVEAKNHGGGTTARKVVTRGTHPIAAGELIAEAIAKLRQGYEVRFTDSAGEDAIRLYPCVAKGTDHMEPSLRPMGLLKTAISDKKVTLSGTKERKAANAAAGDEPVGVTPDIMMRCEVCGHMQRVGKKR